MQFSLKSLRLALLWVYLLHVNYLQSYLTHFILFIKVFVIVLLNTFRAFAGGRQDAALLKYLAIGYSLFNGFGRPVWGWLFDKFQFKRLFIILNVFVFLISSTIYFTVEITALFSILVLFTGFLQAGLFAILPSFVNKIFGLK